ncbi:MAG: hypothetical protein GX750_08250 [Clostridia bacterium]|nr:hypothetical protein [Clostridia bacterium]
MANHPTIRAIPIDAKSFEPYGQVIEARGVPQIINQGTGKRYNNLAEVDMTEGTGVINLGILHTQAMEPSFNLMERHHYTSQTFIPLNGTRSLVAVAPPQLDQPQVDQIEVFILEGNQGVNFNRKTWHHTLIPIDGPGECIIMNRGGDIPDDCELVYFDNEQKIIIEF